MDELKERIDRLSELEGAVCPVCGQPLDAEDRQRMIDELNAQGRELGDRFRANQTLLRESEAEVRDLENQIAGLAQVDADLRRQQQRLAQLSSRIELLESQEASWKQNGEPRLSEVTQALQSEAYEPEARQRLAEIDAELLAIGYDAAAHDAARRRVGELRTAADDIRTLEKAQAAQAPLEREIAGLQAEQQSQQEETARQQEQYSQADEALVAAQAQAPDLEEAESLLFQFQEEENRLRLEVGAARQRVLVLEDLKARRETLGASARCRPGWSGATSSWSALSAKTGCRRC